MGKICRKTSKVKKSKRKVRLVEIITTDYVKYPAISVEDLLQTCTRAFFRKYVSLSDSLTFAWKDFHFIAMVGDISKINMKRMMIAKWKGNLMAVKVISKDKLIQEGKFAETKKEMRLLSSFKHPFIMNCHLVNDNANIYYVMTFACLGDLEWLIICNGWLEEEHAKFYAAQIVAALEFLHCLRIVHGDLIAEHVLICHDGYVKLTSFGCASVNGDLSVDYAALGRLIWRMCYRSLSASQAYPDILSTAEIPLLDIVLHLTQGKIGPYCTAQIRTHEWFANFPWTLLINKVLPPPKLFKENCSTAPLRYMRNPQKAILCSKEHDQYGDYFRTY